MVDRFDANQARQIAEAHDPSVAVDAILASVRRAAERGDYVALIRDFNFGSSVCYGAENTCPPLCQAIVKDLRSLGFRCDVRSEDRQFVDLWLEVTWAKEAGKEGS